MKRLLILVVLVITGCAQVPTKRIKFGSASAWLPMDASAEHLKIGIDEGTNHFQFEATGWKTRNSPAAVAASTEQVRARFEGAEALVRTGMETAFQLGKQAAAP
jgi:hypothetical protein